MARRGALTGPAGDRWHDPFSVRWDIDSFPGDQMRGPFDARQAQSEAVRRVATRLWLAPALLLLFAGCGADDPFGPEIPADVEMFVTLMNDHRASVGCGPLTWSGDVAEVAQAHSDDMVERDFFAHENPDGASPFDRLSAAGVTYSRAAENIAWGYSSAQAVLDGWIGSDGHRRNLENCALTHHGVGLTDWHWTHVFVTP